MTRIVVVTSGKGGVGKTTTSASIGTGLAMAGHKTVIIDFDIGLRKLDLTMGCERRVVYDLINVIRGEATLSQALIYDKRFKEHLFILPASQTKAKDTVDEAGLERVMQGLRDMNFDFILCDSPAGNDHGAQMALKFADEAIVVANPEVQSVRDADSIIGLLQSKSRRAEQGLEPVKEHLLVTRYNPKLVEEGSMMSYADVQELLRIPLIGVIPDSDTVLTASNEGTPVILVKDSAAAGAYEDAVARFLGEERPLRFTTAEKPGLFKRLFGGK